MATGSVIIATYNRAPLLDDCLGHLSRMQFERGDEVIVVDNGSTDSTSGVIGRHAQSFPVPLRQLSEPRPGKSHALEAALAVANGDIWAFTDDDVNVSSGWLAAIRAAFTNREIALVGGPVAPRWEGAAPRWLQRGTRANSRFQAPLALLDYGPECCALGDRTLLGANLAIRREVMQHVGGFCTQLGKRRGTLLSGEDHELCRRVQAAGFTAMYTPSAPVSHWVPRHRMRVAYFLSWFYWSGITNAALDRAEPSVGRTILGVPAYLGRRLAFGLVAAPAAALRGRVHEAFERAFDVAFATGYAAARWRLAGVPASAPPAPQRADVSGCAARHNN